LKTSLPFRSLTGFYASLALWTLCGVSARAELAINATYLDSGGETWDSVSRGVIEQAISEWTAVLQAVNPGVKDDIDITFDFTNAGTGSYLGQWQGSGSASVGIDRLPWENTSHIIHFNADQLDSSLANYGWWDPTPGDDGSDQPFVAWDLLSVARHELGHALGFTSFYVYDNGTVDELYPWEALITNDGGNAIFDQGGLNAQMASLSNIGHLGNTGNSLDALMTSNIPNGTRREISQLEIDMLTMAYGYASTIPEPSALLLATLGALGILRRRR